MGVFDQKITEQLKGFFNNLKDEVNVNFFSQEFECGSRRDAGDFIREITSLNEKLNLHEYDFVKNKSETDLYNVDKIPALAVTDKDNKDTGIKFYGIPGGYEINTFIETMIEVSGVRKPLEAGVLERIRRIDKPVHIQVLVSLQCPYCPEAVHAAIIVAHENPLIRAEMVDAGEFSHLAVKYNVTSVPKTVINEKYEFTGALPVDKLLDEIDKALR